MSVHFLKARGLWFSKWRENGKEKRRYFKTQAEAESFEAERAATVQDDRLTLGDLAIKYFQSNPHFHSHTKKNIVHMLAGYTDGSGKHINGMGEFLRDKYAESLNRKDLEKLRELYRSKGTGNATINRYQAYIRAILAFGVDQELIRFNPWRDFKLLKTKKMIFYPKIEDLRKLYQFLPPYLQWAVKTAFFLALRPGQVELFTLTWDSYNWNRGIAVIRQGKSGKLKTVVLHPAYQQEAYCRYIEDMKHGVIYVCHRDGQRVLSFKTAWKSACKKAGVEMRPYDIRHIAASEMLARGADLASVAAQLGHSSVATTGAVYAHATASGQSLAAGVMPPLDDNKGILHIPPAKKAE